MGTAVTLLLVCGLVGGKVYADNQKAQEQKLTEKVEKEQQTKEKKRKTDTEIAVNNLFEKAIIDNKDAEKIAVKNNLKSETIKNIKEKYYVEKTDSAWQKIINESIVNAENQVNQIDLANKAVGKVFKENKVVNTEQKNYDTAKKEVEKVKNTTIKKELSAKLSKVKAEIGKQNKAKKETEQVNDTVKETNESPVEPENTNNGSATSNEQQVNQESTPANTPIEENQGGSDWQAPANDTGSGSSDNGYVAPTPPPANTGGNTETPPTTGGTQGEPEWEPDMGWGQQSGKIDGNGGTWSGGFEEVK